MKELVSPGCARLSEVSARTRSRFVVLGTRLLRAVNVGGLEPLCVLTVVVVVA